MSTPKKWLTSNDGEWIRVGLKTRKALGCCDCGLVHWIKFRMTNGRLYMAAIRDNELTKNVWAGRGERGRSAGAEKAGGETK